MLARTMISAAFIVTGMTGCSFTSDEVAPDSPVGVQGQVVDFQTGAQVTATDLTVSGLSPTPKVTLNGSSFTLEGVLQNSAFEVLAVAQDHRSTASQVVVTTSGVSSLKAPVVSEAFVTTLATAFGAAPSLAKGIVLLHLVDASGKPRAGVTAASFTIAGTNGPHFLDANLMPAPTATASSSSGWVVFFDVPPGVAGVSQGLSVAVTIDMPASPIAGGVVTIVEGKVTDGAQVLPSNVSFPTQIVPIFKTRGCVACHSGNGPGKDLGGLTLDGGTKLIYKELVLEKPSIRVNVGKPETSLVLTMPSREDPPDGHPNVTFTGPLDPDYLKLLVWIREGAKEN
jgi:hypothetical protein